MKKMLDKDFHVLYTNVIFVICLNQIYLKRFLCRVLFFSLLVRVLTL